MRYFRVVKSHERVYIQHYQPTLFGNKWVTLWQFISDCESDCREIVRLLNKCNEKSQDQ